MKHSVPESSGVGSSRNWQVPRRWGLVLRPCFCYRPAALLGRTNLSLSHSPDRAARTREARPASRLPRSVCSCLFLRSVCSAHSAHQGLRATLRGSSSSGPGAPAPETESTVGGGPVSAWAESVFGGFGQLLFKLRCGRMGDAQMT